MLVIGFGNRVMFKVGWIFFRRLFNWLDFSEILKFLFLCFGENYSVKSNFCIFNKILCM